MLHFSEWPDLHDPHRCGDAPFVPNVTCERANSCGSYEAGFNEKGCNKWRPNYPDDMYIEQHGCKGLADCEDGEPPMGDMVKEGTLIRKGPPTKLPYQHFWPADGYGVNQQIPQNGTGNTNYLLENFDFSGPNGDLATNLFYLALIVGIVWLTTKR